MTLKRTYILHIIGVMLPLAFARCTADVGVEGQTEPLPRHTPVLFSSGATEGGITTRATAEYLPQGGRFVCRMYYKGNVGNDDYSAYNEAWLQVNNNYGNSVFRKNTFEEPQETDGYGFDKASQIFYWQNRKEQAFSAIADYNRLKTAKGTDEGSLRMLTDATLEGTPIVIDIRRTPEQQTISDQKDIIQAFTEMKPAGYTPEANRVRLFFNHCFSQVQVNLKPTIGGGLDGTFDDNGTTKKAFDYENIDKIELLGISDTAYVYVVPPYSEPKAKDILASNYPDADPAENMYFTSIEMYKENKENVTSGYVCTHNVITFGLVQAIRVTWHEAINTDKVHVVTKKVTKTAGDAEDPRILKSGYRHVFNLEMRRGTLAIIQAEILPWEDFKTYDPVEGTIVKP